MQRDCFTSPPETYSRREDHDETSKHHESRERSLRFSEALHLSVLGSTFSTRYTKIIIFYVP